MAVIKDLALELMQTHTRTRTVQGEVAEHFCPASKPHPVGRAPVRAGSGHTVNAEHRTESSCLPDTRWATCCQVQKPGSA